MPFSTESVTTRPVDQLAQLGDQPRQQQDANKQGQAGTRSVAQVSANTNSALKLAGAATPSVPPHANDKVAPQVLPRSSSLFDGPYGDPSNLFDGDYAKVPPRPQVSSLDKRFSDLPPPPAPPRTASLYVDEFADPDELRARSNAITERPVAGYQNPYSTTKHAKAEVFDHIKEVPNDPTYSKLNESQEVIEAQAEGLYGGLESPEDRTYESIDYDPKDHEYAELENVRFQAMRNIDQRGEANL